MPVSQNYRRTNKDEVKISLILQKEFKKQKAFLEEHLERLVSQVYNINQSFAYLQEERKRVDPLEEFWDEMGLDEMIKKVIPVIKKVVEKGWRRSYRKFKPKFEKFWIEYSQDFIRDYASQFAEIQLSDYKGSIKATTKLDIVKTIKEWLDNNSTYTEIQQEITKVSETLFDPARAKMIACTEIWRAYEYGNYYPVQQLKTFWVQFKKKRSTVQDLKVRPAHTANEDEGRVPEEHIYSATWTPICWMGTDGINCRCTMLYEIF